MNLKPIPPRSNTLEKCYPQGIPALWADMLTHFNSQGSIDWQRTEAHFNFVQKHVQGFIVAGLAGQSDDLSSPQIQELTQWYTERAKRGRQFILLGPNTHHDIAIHPADAGFLVHASHQPVRAAIASRHPFGIWLDPQQNHTLSVEEIARIAQDHENLLYILDATRDDALAAHPALPRGVMRYHCRDIAYAQSLASTGGLYQGLMLASAAIFPETLAQIVLNPALGKWDDARLASDTLASFIHEAQHATAPLIHSHNIQHRHQNLALCKAMDQVMALGAAATQAPPPMLTPTMRLPEDCLTLIASLLAKHHLTPQQGYLA